VGGDVITENAVLIEMLECSDEGCIGQRRADPQLILLDPLKRIGHFFVFVDASAGSEPEFFCRSVESFAKEHFTMMVTDDEVDRDERGMLYDSGEEVGGQVIEH